MSDDWPALLTVFSSAQWQLQWIFVAMSLLFLASYFAGYAIAHRRDESATFTLPGYLCLVGSGASLSWFVMPLLPQPRMPGILDLIQGWDVSYVALATQAYGLFIGVWFFRFTVQSTKSNWSVTYHRFFAPDRLLTDGRYGIVRHPMLIGDFLCHAGIAVALGAIYTTLLIVIYYVIVEVFIEIQERYVLYPKFGDEYRAYAKQTPRSWNRALAGVAGIGIVLVAITFAEIWNQPI